MRSNPFICFVLCITLFMCVGCGTAALDTTEITVALTIDPSPPLVGEAKVSLMLAHVDGIPLAGADVRVEANMNHAGMRPSFADLREAEPGRYEGTLEFTMGGDWFILVTVKTSAGEMTQHKVDVPGVRSP